MCKEKGMERLLPKVKKTVDSVYEYLIPHPDGCGMSAKDYGRRGARVVSLLVKRNIIEKTNLGRGEYKYRWIATMSPTPTLYRSITLEIQAEDREYYETHKKKAPAPRAEETPAVVNDLVEQTQNPFDEVKALWERMKELGATIEDNRIVLVEVRKTFLS